MLFLIYNILIHTRGFIDGQERNITDRTRSDVAIGSISAGLRGLFGQIRSIESEREKQSAKQYAVLAEQGAQLGSIANAIGSISDAICNKDT